MTTRLTVEMQRVPYRQYRADAARSSRSTALRPAAPARRSGRVVACKGTTCQYGLIDTGRALARASTSKLLHRLARRQRLPHKFKIAVGGCPNNCVKPDLNDIGVIGQRVPAARYGQVPRLQGLPN